MLLFRLFVLFCFKKTFVYLFSLRENSVYLISSHSLSCYVTWHTHVNYSSLEHCKNAQFKYLTKQKLSTVQGQSEACYILIFVFLNCWFNSRNKQRNCRVCIWDTIRKCHKWYNIQQTDKTLLH